MSFAVNSISTITPQCRAFVLPIGDVRGGVMQRSAPSRNGKILFAGVFNCRHISGSSSWSQHAFGNAVDLFAHEADLQAIAENVVRQATADTRANQGNHQPCHYVIWKEGAGGIWSPDRGWHTYTGFHPPTHVHVDFLPEREGTPPCA